ncbi:hypothetical protein [Leucobacter aridicollis]|uniref:hypothetical protein n=1 Tax=Leucobacter aridicollis TaxID=283878 RepID=UPI00210765A0|nr:hypothetical protein [Leucobacter aridicollis]UTX53279.1 hypothetical protein KI794_00475 [Leucobacter aridicollis]
MSMYTQSLEPGTIQTLLFGRDGRPVTGEHRSFYEATSPQVSLKFGTIPGHEMHVVIANGAYIVVTRSRSSSRPFYVQDRIVDSLHAGIDYIQRWLPKDAASFSG